jgi:hypothetical protein
VIPVVRINYDYRHFGLVKKTKDFPGTDKLRKKYVVPALAGCIKTNFRDVKYAFVRIV